MLNRSANVPLPLLQQEFQESYQRVKSDLVDLINYDYADFVSLSTKLVGLDDRLDSIQAPLDNLAQQLQVLPLSFHNFRNLYKLIGASISAFHACWNSEPSSDRRSPTVSRSCQ